MREATPKEFETVKKVFEIQAVKILFKHLLEENLITKKEYELLIMKCEEDIKEILENKEG